MENCPTCGRLMPGTIRDDLRTARFKKGLSQRALSEMAGVSTSAICNADLRKGGIGSPRRRRALATALDLPLSQIPGRFPSHDS